MTSAVNSGDRGFSDGSLALHALLSAITVTLYLSLASGASAGT